MLVLTRRTGESVKLIVEPSSEKIEIEVVTFGVEKGQIKLGIKAPNSVNVIRTEVLGRPGV